MALYASILTGGVNNHTTTSEEANYIATDFVTNGIVGAIANTAGVAPATGGYACNAQGTPDMTIAVTAGAAWVTGTPSGQNSQTFRATLSANQNVTIAANSSGSTKYDWVYVKFDPTNGAAPNLAGDNVFTLTTSRSSSATTDNGTPPTYGYCIAVVTVANGASSITNGNIADKRVQVAIGAQNTSVSTGWNTTRNGVVLPAPNTVTYNGNRSYDLVFNSTDLTGYISPGMRLRTSRTVAAPTQCTSLNGTTQAWTKSSPNKLTFTDNFTLEWKGIVNAYGTQVLVSRTTSASDGFKLYLESDGRISIRGQNAGSTFRMATSYQSVPLGKRITIQGSLIMSSGTGSIYLDDVLIPSTVTGTATSLVQAGTLSIGADVGGTTLFLNGKTFRYAIYDAVISAVTLRASSSQALTGTETNLKCGSNFNGNANDVNTTTPNDLSAVGSATATNADSAFTVDANGTPGGTYDYAIVQKAVYSGGNTTLTVQVPEGCAIPTSGGVSAVAYSSVKAPFGMPVSTDRWEVSMVLLSAAPTSGTVISTVYNPGGLNLNLPIGDWNFAMNLDVYTTSNANVFNISAGISTSNSAFSNTAVKFVTKTLIAQASTSNTHYFNVWRSGTLSVSSATPLYILLQNGSAFTVLGVNGFLSTTQPENTYLSAIPSNL